MSHHHPIVLADGVRLPVDVVTQTVGVLAKRRAGKSYLARRFVEQLHGAAQQVVIVDPKGDWWGIRSDAAGAGPGLPIVIIGGEHGDVPLETGGGELVAKLVVEERVPALLDLSLLRKHEVATFMTAFLESFYRLKAREQYRTPVMLVVDEADAIAPQKPQPNEARMLGAIEDIVRRGGQRGIGCLLVSQRSAVLNKNVLTQVQVLAALRTIAPQDLAALEAWVDVHGTPNQKRTLLESLPALPTGDAWFWSPGWPTDDGIFTRCHVLPIATFDSGASPRPGERRIEPKELADVDLGVLRRQMEEVVARARENDPKQLRGRIAELQRDLEDARKAPAAPALTAGQIAQLHQVAAVLRGVVAQVETVLMAGGAPEPSPPARPAASPPPPSRAPARRASPPPEPTRGGDKPIKKGARAMLAALASLHPRALTRQQVGTLAGLSANSGSFSNYLSTLRGHALIEEIGGTVALTAEGLAHARAAGVPPPRRGTEQLVEMWASRLKAGARRMLVALVNQYPKDMTRAELGAVAEIAATSGSFSNYLSSLRSNGLIEEPSVGLVRASASLFLTRDV